MGLSDSVAPKVFLVPPQEYMENYQLKYQDESRHTCDGNVDLIIPGRKKHNYASYRRFQIGHLQRSYNSVPDHFVFVSTRLFQDNFSFLLKDCSD